MLWLLLLALAGLAALLWPWLLMVVASMAYGRK
jgi:hypothetical protein